MKNEIVLYHSDKLAEHIEVRIEEDTLWLTQAQIAQLFGTEIPAISKHINNIYNVGELDKNSTISILEILFTPVFRISVSTTLRLKSLGSCMALSTRAFTNPSLSSALNALCS